MGNVCSRGEKDLKVEDVSFQFYDLLAIIAASSSDLRNTQLPRGRPILPVYTPEVSASCTYHEHGDNDGKPCQLTGAAWMAKSSQGTEIRSKYIMENLGTVGMRDLLRYLGKYPKQSHIELRADFCIEPSKTDEGNGIGYGPKTIRHLLETNQRNAAVVLTELNKEYALAECYREDKEGKEVFVIEVFNNIWRGR